MIRKLRYYIFLKDVLVLAVSAFGGPQAHIAILFDLMVKKRQYLTEEELIELNALCQILPGPTSTQTITAIGFKIGGPKLAFLTLLVWILPAVSIMTAVGVIISNFQEHNISLSFTKFIQPMAVGFVAYAAYRIGLKVIHSLEGVFLLVISAVIAFFFPGPYIFPILLLAGGAVTALKFKSQEQIKDKSKLKIEWGNFILWAVVFIAAAIIGGVTGLLPIRLFENFYRNGSLIFGGGQVLIPLLFKEFVEFKSYLSSEEFLTGFGIVQAVPGPVFSFSAYIGALSMREYGIGGEIVGSFFAAAGIFLPGTFMIFFVIRFWSWLKKYRVVRASIEGINAVSSGMVAAAAFLLSEPLETNFINGGIVIGTICLLVFTKIPAPFIILGGLIAGFIF